jgi:hypothetical protein
LSWKTRCAAATASLLLVLALGGLAAGADRSAPPRKWVANLCGSLVTWERTVETEFTRLKTTIAKLKRSGSVRPAAAKAELVRFLGRIVHSTNRLLGKLQAVGPPAVENGGKLQAALLDGLAEVNKAFENGKKAAQALPTGSRRAFGRAAQRLAAAVAAGVNQSTGALSALSRYDTKALDHAFKTTPACSKLAG